MEARTCKSNPQKSTARVSLAEVCDPCVRWEGPGSGFESSSGAAGGAAGDAGRAVEAPEGGSVREGVQPIERTRRRRTIASVVAVVDAEAIFV